MSTLSIYPGLTVDICDYAAKLYQVSEWKKISEITFEDMSIKAGNWCAIAFSIPQAKIFKF